MSTTSRFRCWRLSIAAALDASKEIRLVTYSPCINALVVARTKRAGVMTEPLLMWHLVMPEEFFRRHQRSHVRMDVNLDGKLHISDRGADPPVDRTIYAYKCQFINLSERRQDEVTRYIFAEQLERRRQGRA